MPDSIYISITDSTRSWIIGTIASDIKKELYSKNIKCDIGKDDEYGNQEICFHMSYAYASPNKLAKHNSVFVTHIDDQFKESLVKKKLTGFDSIICMSSDDAKFLVSLGLPKEKVFGLPLPTRSSMIRPLKFGIFSSSYEDGRKNEDWLLDYYKHNPFLKNVILSFIGDNWGDFVTKLAKKDLSFEWHRTSGNIHSEYTFQQNKLDELDYYFYLGFDGGAMGTYDAYSRGINLIIAEGSYHEDIPDVEHMISSFNDFKIIMDNILIKHERKINFFIENSPSKYASNLLDIWEDNANSEIDVKNKSDFLEKKRLKYSKASLRRLASYIRQMLSK